MHDPGRKTGESAQGRCDVKIAQQWGQATGSECWHALRLRGERKQPHPTAQLCGYTLTDVAASDNQHAFPTKTRRQGAKRGLV